MRQRISGGLIAVFISVTLLLACAPKAAPVPSQGPVAPQVTPAKPALATPTMVPEDDAWAKVVAAAKKEGTVNFYSGGSWGGADVIMLTGAFKAKYGISVESITGMAADTLERLKTEKRMGTIVADVFTTTTAIVFEAKKLGFTVSLGDLPALQEKDIWTLEINAGDPEKHMLGYYITDFVSWVNTKMVPPGGEPRGLKDLLLPQWSGQIISTDPVTHTGLYIFFGTYVNRGIVDWEYVKKLGKQKMILTPSSDKSALLLAQGEAPFLLNGPTSIVHPFAIKGAPIRPVPLNEGTVTQQGVVAVIKGAPHPNAARLFVNWLFTREGQEIIGRAKGLPSVRKDVADQTPAAARFIPSTRLLMTLEEYDLVAKLTLERSIVKLWKD